MGKTQKRSVVAALVAASLFALPLTGAYASGGSSTVTLASGSLSMSGAAPGNFSATLNGSDQAVPATLGTYSATDSRGTGAGWHVTFQATTFACTSTDVGCPAAGDTFPASSLIMPPPTVACASGTSCTGKAAPPTISITTNTALDSGSAVTVASAALNKGMGTYNFTPGTITGGSNLQLTVPSTSYATTYHSTLTVSVVSGP